MSKPRSRLALLLLLALLVACAPPLTPQQARATAEAGGCWPSGVDQPSTPGPPPTVRPGTPTPAPVPTVPVYLACTPMPGTPTATVRPTSTPTATVRPTPLRAPALGGVSTIGQPPGHNSNLRVAILPGGGAAVAWTNWGWTPLTGGPDGQVFVRVQTRGQWGLAQTLTRAPVNGDVGGVGIAALEDGTLVVAWGDGVWALWLAESHDAGATWSRPTPIGTFGYQVLGLERDAAGGLHLLALTADPHQLRYAYRAPTETRWRAAALPFAGEHLGGALAVLSRADGVVRRFVVARLGGTVGLAASEDGQRWTPVRVELGRFMREDNPDKVAVLAASRSAGDLIAVAWSQYSAGGVFAQLSTDGGATWGREERIAQHQADGACADSTSGSGLACGYWPSLAYDAETDSLAVAWVELVRRREPDRRTVLSARRLGEVDGWRFVVAPDTGANAPPVLATWGWQGTLYGTASGTAAWLLLRETRNDQDRVEARPIALPALLGAAAS